MGHWSLQNEVGVARQKPTLELAPAEALADAMQARHEAEERFRLLVENIQGYALYALDNEGNIANWNEGARRLNGYTSAEIVGRHYSVLFTRADQESRRADELLREALATGRAEDIGWRVRKDGSRFRASVTMSAIRDEAGVNHGVANVVRDITQELKTRENLERLHLLEQRERLGRDLHDGIIQSIFAAGMTLQATTGMLRDPFVAERINGVIDDLDTMVRDLRSYIFALGSPLDGGTFESELNRLIGDLEIRTGMLSVTALNEAASLPFKEHAEDVLLIVKEALSNIARHSSAKTCAITLEIEGDDAILTISDDGSGFDVGNTAPGLGLANAKTRAQSIGATYKISSGRNGTRITLTLPANEIPLSSSGSAGRPDGEFHLGGRTQRFHIEDTTDQAPAADLMA